MLLIEDLAAVVLWLMVLIICINLLLLAFVFYRRLSRKRYYGNKDAARERYRQPVAAFVSKEISTESAVVVLAEATALPERDAVRDLLLAEMGPQDPERISEMLFALRYVDQWAREAFERRRAKALIERSMRREKAAISTGVKRSLLNPVRRLRLFAVPRALAVDRLGRLAPEYAQVFIAEALHDPATEVRRIAVLAMGRNRLPAAIPLLLEELRKGLEEGNDISLRSAKLALVRYGMDDLHHFVPMLTHPAPRMRFFVVDTVREICRRAARHSLLSKNDFPRELYEHMLEKAASDPFGDVRARSAEVIKHFHDQRAIEALRRLMKDSDDFVRLHAVRSSADRFYASLIPDLAQAMTDARWRPREAAVRALASFGVSGTNEVYRQFVSTPDRYASEQITEEVQRGGLAPDLIAALSSGGVDAQLAKAVCQKMALLGKTSLLTSAVASLAAPEPRILLMEALMMAPTEEFLGVLNLVAQSDGGPVGARAASLLQQAALQAAARPAGGAVADPIPEPRPERGHA